MNSQLTQPLTPEEHIRLRELITEPEARAILDDKNLAEDKFTIIGYRLILREDVPPSDAFLIVALAKDLLQIMVRHPYYMHTLHTRKLHQLIPEIIQFVLTDAHNFATQQENIHKN